ncbi:MAG: ribonuclease III [Minisyncoccia bacterium]
MDTATHAASLKLSFKNLALLEEALTHRSYINEHKDAGKHNERLEFLGDAVLELSATGFLFEKFPAKSEGELTAYRAALVNTYSLAEVAGGLLMNDMLRLSRGEKRDVGRARDVILANAFEAVVGALYLDQGYEAADAFLHTHLYTKLDSIIEKKGYQDAKSRFQEVAQDKKGITPNYKTNREDGPYHEREFTVGVYIGEKEMARGSGKSKQEAEQAAAKAGLDKTGW